MKKFGIDAVDEELLPKFRYPSGENPWLHALGMVASAGAVVLGSAVVSGPFAMPLMVFGSIAAVCELIGVFMSAARRAEMREWSDETKLESRYVEYFSFLPIEKIPASLLSSTSSRLRSVADWRLRRNYAYDVKGLPVKNFSANVDKLVKAAYPSVSNGTLKDLGGLAISDEKTDAWLQSNRAVLRKDSVRKLPVKVSRGVYEGEGLMVPAVFSEVDGLVRRYAQAAKSFEDVLIGAPETIRAELAGSVAVSVEEFERRAGLVKNLPGSFLDRKRKKLVSHLSDDCLRLESLVGEVTELIFDDPNSSLKEISAVTNSFLKAERSLKSLKLN